MFLVVLLEQFGSWVSFVGWLTTGCLLFCIQLAHTFALRGDGKFIGRAAGRAVVPFSCSNNEDNDDGHDDERSDDTNQSPKYRRHVEDDGLSCRTDKSSTAFHSLASTPFERPKQPNLLSKFQELLTFWYGTYVSAMRTTDELRPLEFSDQMCSS